MLPRVKNKQLTNVSIVTLKKFGKKYELAVFPNKLYEYRHNSSVPLDTILHSENIYRNISAGDVCSEADLKLFSSGGGAMCRADILHYILQNGYEQKAQQTSAHELSNVEKQIVDLLQNKVKYNGSYVSKETLLEFVKKVWNIRNSDPKKQVSGIIRKLEELGFERVTFKVKVDVSQVEFENAIKEEDGVVVKSDVLPEFMDYCEGKQLKYVVIRNEEAIEEEIC